MTAEKVDHAQGDLFDPASARRPVGGMEAACKAATTAAGLGTVDAAAVQLAVELGRAVDLGNARRDPYAVAAAGRELREQLARLKLDPASREGGPAGDVEAFLRDLAAPS